MRNWLIISLLLLSVPAYAQKNYLKCLGAEESYIHKMKIGGAYKALNQSLLNELIMFNTTVAMSADLEKRICQNPQRFPSLQILEEIFHNKTIFYSSIKNRQLRQYSIDKVAIDSFRKQSKFVFLKFLSNLHGQVNDPKCLEKEFPELKEFFLRTKHILIDVGIVRLFEEIPNKKRLFKKLKSLSWQEQCQKKP